MVVMFLSMLCHSRLKRTIVKLAVVSSMFRTAAGVSVDPNERQESSRPASRTAVSYGSVYIVKSSPNVSR